MRPDIYQIELIGSGSLSIMAKPVSGDWIEEEFKNISSLGINRIVSLLEAAEAYEVGLEEEPELTKKYGMDFVSFPILDRGLPDSLEGYGHLIHSLYLDTAGGLNTVVHCRSGIGRASLVAAGVLLYCGFEPSEAFSHISKKRGVSVPDTEEQYEWLINHSRTLLNQST